MDSRQLHPHPELVVQSRLFIIHHFSASLTPNHVPGRLDPPPAKAIFSRCKKLGNTDVFDMNGGCCGKHRKKRRELFVNMAIDARQPVCLVTYRPVAPVISDPCMHLHDGDQ